MHILYITWYNRPCIIHYIDVIILCIIYNTNLYYRWLEVKNWLMHSKKKLALANKRHWKRYWVTLRGTTLMFYSCDDQVL